MRILNLAVHSCFTRFNDVKLKNRQIENGVEFGLRCHAEGPREIREGIRKNVMPRWLTRSQVIVC